jgi:hypothetical protein
MFKILLTVFFAFCLAFTPVFAQSGVQSGKFTVNSSTSGFNLDKNSGDRSVTVEINFPKPFDVKPSVVLSVTSIDADKDTNLRYNIEAVSVSRDGFIVKVSTWSDTKIHGISGQWIAHVE